MTYLVIDTNVCLHFTPIDQYPWSNQIKDENGLVLVITHPLIEELDKKKYSGKNHLKTRATKILKLIEKIDQVNPENSCKLYLYNENINKDYVESLGLDNTDGDDRMLASIIKFRGEEENRNIRLVTNDLGPRLKATKFDIQSLIPDPKYQLKSPEDELEKAIKLLKIENERLKNLIPKLSITFQNEETLVKYKVTQISKNRKEFIDYEMMQLKEKYPRFKLSAEIEKERELEKLKERDAADTDLSPSNRQFLEAIKKLQPPSFGGITEENKEKYNSELFVFFMNYERYLKELYDYNVQKTLTIEINFELNNDGTAPAEDIDIYFHFPDGFELFDENSYSEEPTPPNPPYKPTSVFEMNLLRPRIPLVDSSKIINNFSIAKPNISGPSIKKTNSYDVDVHVAKLKHNKIAILDKMFVVFDDYESLVNFRVDYELRCSNIPNVISGKLNFIVEKGNSM